MQGVYEHCDLASYNLNAHAIKTHKKKMFKNQDMTNICQRVKIVWPTIDESELPSLLVVDHLPVSCRTFLDRFESGSWKVEWMFNGSYDYQMSDTYKQRFTKYSRQSERGLYSKLWDTMGFSKPETSFKMWVESLYRPGTVIRYEGNAFHIDTSSVKCQIARMLSHVYDYNHIVTVTIIE